MPQWGITGAGVAALASSLIIATALAVVLLYRNRLSARTSSTAGDSPACVADAPRSVMAIAGPADELLLSPVVAFALPADGSPPENTDWGEHS